MPAGTADVVTGPVGSVTGVANVVGGEALTGVGGARGVTGRRA
jgi:hypothetical protein